MKTFFLIALTLGFFTNTHAGTLDAKPQQISIRLMPAFQNWSAGENGNLSETSTGIELFYPGERYWDVSLRAARATTGGEGANISSLTDIQIDSRYSLPSSNLVFTLGVSLPSGAKEFSLPEFATASILSNTIFDYQVRSFGQGWNLHPGMIWAAQIDPAIAFGLGASYLLRGSYRPISHGGDYDPGDEVLLTGGTDVRLNPTTFLSGDLIFTLYGKDKIDGEEVFASGGAVIVGLRLREYLDKHELTVGLRYRTKAKSEFVRSGSLLPDEVKLIPNELIAWGSYRIPIGPLFGIRILGEGKFSEKTLNPYSGMAVLGVGIQPEISLSPNIALTARAKFNFGSMKDNQKVTGSELSAGLLVKF